MTFIENGDNEKEIHGYIGRCVNFLTTACVCNNHILYNK